MDRSFLPLFGSFAIFCFAASFPVTLFAGQNCRFTVPLHAVVGGGEACITGGPAVDCREVWPTVNVPPNVDSRIYVLIHHAVEITSLQTAFEWDPSWDLIGSEWQCQAGQIVSHVPDPSSPTGGPTDGVLVTHFDCILNPMMIVVGHMDFRTGSQGTSLGQIDPGPPHWFGIHVRDCANETDIWGYDQRRLGRVAVTAGGYAACDLPPHVPPQWCTCLAGGPYSGQVGIPVEFSGSMDGCDPQYAMWDFGDGDRGFDPTHTYETAGTYVVRLIFDGPPCANSDTECETTATIQSTAGVEQPEPAPGVVPSTWGRVKADRN